MELKLNLKKIFYALMQAGIASVLIVSGAFAADVEVIGSIKQAIKQESLGLSKAPEKEIQLLHIQLSDEAKKLLLKRADNVLTNPNKLNLNPINSPLPEKVELGMNKVPVLDQGIYGTCTTFAITGAVDAIIGNGDYVSQLCQLQLGTYLERHGYSRSGWEGSNLITVINQMEEFGIVSMKNQHSTGCGGVKKYPTRSRRDVNSFIEPEAYSLMSEMVFGKVLNWTDILAPLNDNRDPEKILQEVKEALNSGDRLVFATLLPRIDLGVVGAVGKHNTWMEKDTWVLTLDILDGLNTIEAAHDMIITGYDDNAVAVDDWRVKHHGLLTLRNSWSSSVGYYGEFYMTYEYFKLLAFNIKRFSAN